MTLRHRRPLALLSVLMALILFSNMQGLIQSSYAAEHETGLRTLSVKVGLDKSIIEQGEKQTIRFQLTDQKGHGPISAAITSATVAYADGETVRQFSAITDESGRSSISWKMEHNAPPGRYGLVYSAVQTGYVPESFTGSFSVVSGVVKGTLSSSSSPSDSSSISSSSSSPSDSSSISSSNSPSISSSNSSSIILDVPGPSTYVAPSQTSLTTSDVPSQTSQTTNPVFPSQTSLTTSDVPSQTSQTTNPVFPSQTSDTTTTPIGPSQTSDTTTTPIGPSQTSDTTTTPIGPSQTSDTTTTPI
ncbi:MAG TPA: hypothetical protein VH500_18590, partial [Nitrososphaeraceae archaeon]